MAVPGARPYGLVENQPIGEMSRRAFLGRMLGVGAGILALEFIGGSIAFLWPQIRSGLGAKFPVGTLADIVAKQPSFANGWPYAVAAARSFLINVPAAKELALGNEAFVPNPGAAELLALYRKCPHLGCQVPGLIRSAVRPKDLRTAARRGRCRGRHRGGDGGSSPPETAHTGAGE